MSDRHTSSRRGLPDTWGGGRAAAGGKRQARAPRVPLRARATHVLGVWGSWRLRRCTTSWNVATVSLQSSFTSRKFSAPTCRKCSKSCGALMTSCFRRMDAGPLGIAL